MSTLGGFCLGLSLGFLLSAPAVEPERAAQLRVLIVMVFALVGVALL